ncbi:uncharacterized protein YukE [Actinoplanes lutulentus]|uniref:Excreted virulence factor EspC (Type VII ESX diderm) n=1 Tax=Actinoplanes lutulentus TaxID=1287878 RepID=A0A327YUZ0_9ACTN|nr:hypothetical protein [Actinoplanes lutulentus]MBB2940537.1 uncharacterized protein YukE [Actinoplanes lutulentus]RAK24807.1 hypothetical protein B0I29_13513 [Actinoplanes lutulentus]
MTLRVDPAALRLYAAQMTEMTRAAEAAKSYIDQWGSLTPHERGFLGIVFQRHPNYVERIDAMLDRVRQLTDASAASLTTTARTYEATDSSSAAELDASYSPSPRPMIFRD